jgi:hypothetical protein
VGMIEPRRLISGQNLVGTSFQVHFATLSKWFRPRGELVSGILAHPAHGALGVICVPLAPTVNRPLQAQGLRPPTAVICREHLAESHMRAEGIAPYPVDVMVDAPAMLQ